LKLKLAQHYQKKPTRCPGDDGLIDLTVDESEAEELAFEPHLVNIVAGVFLAIKLLDDYVKSVDESATVTASASKRKPAQRMALVFPDLSAMKFAQKKLKAALGDKCEINFIVILSSIRSRGPLRLLRPI